MLSPRALKSAVRVVGAWLLLVTPAAGGDPVSVVYRCKPGEAASRLEGTLPVLASDTLENLQQWDLFAMESVTRAVRGEARRQDVMPLMLALLRSGPFAGAFGEEGATVDGFLIARAQRLLDAAARLAAGPPMPLMRELLSDGDLVAELRQDASGAAHRGAQWVVEHTLGNRDPQTWLVALLPALVQSRDSVSEPELVARCMEKLDRGQLDRDLTQLLALTTLWDLRLYLYARGEAELQAALGKSDDELAADIVQATAPMHLRYFLFGGREKAEAARRWEALEAERFIAERPGWSWVAQAAALAHELERGVLLRVTGEPTAVLPAGGETPALTYTVQPAAGATFATAALVWPRSVAKTYEGVRCLADTAAHLCPAPFGGSPTLSALLYRVAFTATGTQRLTFQYSLYGLALPVVTHPVEVLAPGASAVLAQVVAVPVPVQVTQAPAGYVPVFNGGLPVAAGQPAVINGGRRLVELPDGQHAMELLILYEVRAAAQDCFPEEVEFCDPNPRGDKGVEERAIAEAQSRVADPLRAWFSLVPSRLRAVGRDCWVGRKGQGPDGRWYYVLCRGTQTYLVRSALYPYQSFWDPVIGQQEVYDASQMMDDTRAYAEAVLRALQIASPQGPPGLPEAAASASTAAAFVRNLRTLVDEDANLVTRTSLVVAAWQQQSLDSQTAAKSITEDVVAAYEALMARAAALQPPDQALAGLGESLHTALSIGMAASRLIEKGLRNGDPDKVLRGMALMHSYDTEREALRTRTMTLLLQYTGAGDDKTPDGAPGG